MQKWMSLLKYFLPERYRDCGVECNRGLVVLAMLLAFFVTFVFAINYRRIGAYNISIHLIESLILAFLALIVMRVNGNIIWSSNLMVLSIAYELIISSMWAGGINSPGVYWYPVVILAVNFYLSLRWTILWSAVFLGGYFYLYLLESYGQLPSNEISPDLLNGFKRDSMLTALCTAIWFSFSYRQQRDLQKTQIDEALKKLELEHVQTEKKLSENINWIRVLTHDLSNPLQIIGFAAAGLDDQLKQKKRIKTALENIGNIINHIRNYRAASDGKVEIQNETFELNEVIVNTMDLFQEKLALKGISIEFELQKNRYFITGDRNVLENMILANILSNAIKFSSKDSNIKIVLSGGPRGIELSVRDYGIGMPAEILTQIFSFSKSTNRKGTMGETGTGYGMPLVKEYMKLFNGEITINSWEQKNSPDDFGTKVNLVFLSETTKKVA
jgi:signal transduction histidine kinase